jgi:flagellar basal-body rod modification protein FlgD
MTSVSSSTATGSNVTPPAATAPVTSPTTTGSTAAAASVDFNSFLQMMIAEMKNQDPTNPSDPTQYLTQIAQFSNVQQGILTNTKLDSMLTATSLTQAESIIGKTVSSASGAVSGTVASVALTGGGNATATLTDGSTLALDSTVKVSAS